MKSFTLALASAALAVTALAGDTHQAKEAAAGGWTSLFDGKTLAGWRVYQRPDATGSRWQVLDNSIALPAADGKDTRGARDIVSTDTYDRFELTWDWKISEGGNSGVKYFVLEDRPSAIGHEYQVIDDERHADAKIGPHRQTAALYDVLPAANRPLKPATQWNTSRIVSNGTEVEHYLNDRLVLKYVLNSAELNAAIQKSKFKDVERFGKLQKGHILLQDHGDQVWYRNIRIRRLPAS